VISELYLSRGCQRVAVYKHHIVRDLEVRYLVGENTNCKAVLISFWVCWVILSSPTLTWPLQNALISSALEVWPSFSLMQAHTCSPSLSSFTPTTWTEKYNISDHCNIFIMLFMFNYVQHSERQQVWLQCLAFSCWDNVSDLCCPLVVVSLTCTSFTFECV